MNLLHGLTKEEYVREILSELLNQVEQALEHNEAGDKNPLNAISAATLSRARIALLDK